MTDKIRLTQYSKFSGCGAKLGPAILDRALCGLSQPKYPELIVDYSNSDDAGVYKITDDIAMINTVDFFPPIVDDSFLFGQIAAANALSDIYAMGGKAKTALSIVCFPENKLDIKILRRIMDGALSKLEEAGAALVGGHSISDDSLIFGLAVTGVVHPKKILLNNSPKINQDIILTKPIGTGTINTALRAGCVSETSLNAAINSMTQLNKTASEIILKYRVSACTDVTGFGLGGHSCEMIAGTQTGFRIFFSEIKFLPDAIEYVKQGLVPAGTYRNKDFRAKFIKDFKKFDDDIIDIFFDPQTSGGLLFTVDKNDSPFVLDELTKNNVNAFKIGETTDAAEKIEIK
ncbi:MAG TPA: selenide, water dikinase SelD [bacterium]|nr:selenide, water dikinase SelD [bacterium]